MAKKKTTSKKGRKTKSNPKKTGNGGLLIILILVVSVLLAITLYTLNSNNNKPVALDGTEKSLASIKKDKKLESKKDEKERPSSTDKKDVVSEKPRTFNPTINEKVEIHTEVDPYYFKRSFDFYWPSYGSDDQIIEHEAYTLKYDENTEQAQWVAYILTKNDVINGKVRRTDDYREDPMVFTGSAMLEDYRGSGYDRGHLMPAGDAKRSKTIMSESFLLSNMSPQRHDFNDGIWRVLEEKVRRWVIKEEELYVVTGPVFKKNNPKKIGNNKVHVPTHFFKVLLDIKGDEIKGIGFIMEHKNLDENSYMSYAKTIDEIEAFTGLNFFPSLPEKYEKQVEGTLTKDLWK